MNSVYRFIAKFSFGLCLFASSATASTVLLGTISYDPFIPGSNGSPGVNAFNIGNYTGTFNLAPDFPITDTLTLSSSVLTLTLSDLSQMVFLLGDIAPGFLLDGSGNPLIQVSDNQILLSAELTAIVSPTTFMLYDGTPFIADSPTIDAIMSASSGQTLVAGVDQTTLSVSGSSASASTPEPASAFLLMAGLVLIGWRFR